MTTGEGVSKNINRKLHLSREEFARYMGMGLGSEPSGLYAVFVETYIVSFQGEAYKSDRQESVFVSWNTAFRIAENYNTYESHRNPVYKFCSEKVSF